MSPYLLGYVVGYVVSVLLSAGWTLAYFQGEFGSRRTLYLENLLFSVAWSVIFCTYWPVTLPAVFCMSEFAKHGWQLRFIDRSGKVQHAQV